MKKYIITTLFFTLFIPILYLSALDMRGIVVDAKTQSPIEGASINISELKRVFISDENGNFQVKNLPTKGNFMIEISCLGYRTIAKSIPIHELNQTIFELQSTIIETPEVVVIGSVSESQSKKNSASVSIVRKAKLFEHPSTNLIDALSRVVGVNQLSTGPASSKPVIRGLTHNRVITLLNGVKQENLQWGDEHGINVDQYDVEKVEILRGAASLLYGSDALGGVVNIIEAPTIAEGKIKTELLSNYQSNSGLLANSFAIQGNKNGFTYKGRYSMKNAHSFYTAGNFGIPNTAFSENNLSTQIGFNKKWGYLNMNAIHLDTELGIPDFSQNEIGQYIKPDSSLFSNTDFNKRTMMSPSQKIQHDQYSLNSTIIIGVGRLKSNISIQNNQRQEIEEDIPKLNMELKTLAFDSKYYIETSNHTSYALGASMSFQQNKNKGIAYLIPNYESQAYGVFLYTKKEFQKTSINGGLRYDYHLLNGKPLTIENETRFGAFKNAFSNVSGALGLTHALNNQLNLKFNVGSAFRAPNIAELSSNGTHEGTFRYEIGNQTLKAERNLQVDASIGYETNILEITFNLYNNYIDNYIYLYRNNNEFKSDEKGEQFPLYRYVQSNANLMGLETAITLHPLKWLHFENLFNYVRAQNTQTKEPLPFIPATNFKSELRFEPNFHTLKITETYFSVSFDNFLTQNRIANEFETTTQGYSLLGFGIGSNIRVGKQNVKINLLGNNILDKKYVDHLNRLKYQNINNPGRNFALTLMLPIIW